MIYLPHILKVYIFWKSQVWFCNYFSFIIFSLYRRPHSIPSIGLCHGFLAISVFVISMACEAYLIMEGTRKMFTRHSGWMTDCSRRYFLFLRHSSSFYLLFSSTARCLAEWFFSMPYGLWLFVLSGISGRHGAL